MDYYAMYLPSSGEDLWTGTFSVRNPYRKSLYALLKAAWGPHAALHRGSMPHAGASVRQDRDAVVLRVVRGVERDDGSVRAAQVPSMLPTAMTEALEAAFLAAVAWEEEDA